VLFWCKCGVDILYMVLQKWRNRSQWAATRWVGILHELLDVEYYRDLETWVIGHSWSLKLVPFESLGAVSYSPSVVTMTVSVAVCEIFSVGIS